MYYSFRKYLKKQQQKKPTKSRWQSLTYDQTGFWNSFYNTVKPAYAVTLY
jgi:hypothetical protein